MERIHRIKRAQGALDALLPDEQALTSEVRTMWLAYWGATFAALGVCYLLGASIEDAELSANFIIMIVLGLFFAFLVVLGARKAHARRRLKLDFVRELLTGLLPETLPGSKVKVRFLLGDSVDERALVRTAESRMGNTKSYYRDRWLRVKLTLADGSNVRLKMSRKMKHKKGNFLYDKRRFDLRITPNSERYEALTRNELEDLRNAIKRAVRVSLHDPAEEVHVRLREDSASLDLKVEQWDAELHAREVVAVIQAFVAEMDTHRAPLAGEAW